MILLVVRPIYFPCRQAVPPGPDAIGRHPVTGEILLLESAGQHVLFFKRYGKGRIGQRNALPARTQCRIKVDGILQPFQPGHGLSILAFRVVRSVVSTSRKPTRPAA